MISINAPRFGLHQCRNEDEQQFLEVLHTRAETANWYALAWRLPTKRLALTIDLSDDEPRNRTVLRTLRVDFETETVWFGYDETMQLGAFDSIQPGVLVHSNRSLTELAAVVADWLEREMCRPIVRHEWDILGLDQRTVKAWVRADTGEELAAGGPWSPDLGTPHRTTPVDVLQVLRRGIG